MIAWLQLNYGLCFAVLFALSELLGAMPSFKSNGVFQAIVNLLSGLKDLLAKKNA